MTGLPNFRVSEGTKPGSAALDIEILHRNEFRVVLLHILGAVSFLCLALFPGYHFVSLFSKSPSLHRLFLPFLSVLYLLQQI